MVLLRDKINMLPSLKVTVDVHGLMAKKSLGQNFLLDRNITDKIVRLSLEKQGLDDYSTSFVFEVGPGPGGLTRSVMACNPKHLTVVEMDERCIDIMQDIKRLAPDVMEIINGDALKIDFCKQNQEPRHIISNLPYNISVPLLVKWLYDIGHYQSLTLMFQKEVADRIMAKTKTKEYGRISILSQLQCNIIKLTDLAPECFVPAPKIWSSVLLFRQNERILSREQIEKVEKLTNIVFAQRRKMIRQSLKFVDKLEDKINAIGACVTMRPEEISPQQFLDLAELIY